MDTLACVESVEAGLDPELHQKIVKFRRRVNAGTQAVAYQTSDKYAVTMGRLCAHGSILCYQTMPGRLRRLLVDFNLWSLDIVNAHPSILHQLLDRVGCPVSALLEYNTCRQAKLAMLAAYYGCPVAAVKNLFTRLCFGGCPRQWSVDNGMDESAHHPFVMSFFSEMLSIKETHVRQFPGFDDAVEFYARAKRATASQKRLYDSACAVYLQDVERQVMMIVRDVCRRKKVGIHSLIHDELLVDTEIDFVPEIQLAIAEVLGFNIEFNLKCLGPTTEDLEWIEDLEARVPRAVGEEAREKEDPYLDLANSQRVREYFKGKILKTLMGLYIYDDQTGMWTRDPDDLYRVVSQSAGVAIRSEPGSKSSFHDLFNKAIRHVRSTVPKIDFLDPGKSNGFLLFSNGVLDCRSRALLPFSASYEFTQTVGRPYEASGSEMQAEVFDRVIGSALVDRRKREYFMEKLGRAVALGGLDREFMVMLGETRCGKGVITSLLNHALGGFVDTFEPDKLLARKSSDETEDKAKALAWVLDIYDRRLVIGNEIPMTTESTFDAGGRRVQRDVGLNMNILKTIVSGGDKLSCRKLFNDAVKIPMNAYIMILANDLPTTYGDRAFQERGILLYADRSASNEAEFDPTLFFKSDPSIKEYVKRSDVQNAFVDLLCAAYGGSLANGPRAKPDFVKMAVSESLGGGMVDVFDWVKDNYTMYPGDVMEDFVVDKVAKSSNFFTVDWDRVGDFYVPFPEMYNAYKASGGRGSHIKFSKELTTKGIVGAQRCVGGRVVKMRVGIRQ